MKELTWDEYYERFYDWAPRTQKSYASRLSNFGDAEEVYEIVHGLVASAEAYAAALLTKALDAGVRFAPEDVIDLNAFFDKPLASRMAENSADLFTREDLEELYSLIDDDTFNRISRKLHIDIFADEDEPEEDLAWDDEELEPPVPKNGLWGAWAEVFGSGGHKHDNGRCDGDLANCPTHYGYRNGR